MRPLLLQSLYSSNEDSTWLKQTSVASDCWKPGPETWVRWVLGDNTLWVVDTLSGEFQFVLRHNDVLLQVEGKDGPFLVL